MTEEIIAALGKVRDLTVIGRNSSFRFKNTADDPKSIAAQLGVAYLLEGSVRKAAERVRISVDLVHASNGVSLWSETFDGELADVFALQTRIADAVAGKLQATLAGGSGDYGDATRSVAAHTALLQANFYANKQTEADMRKAIAYYEEAVRLDPGYALAQASLSRALSDLGAIWLGGEESRAALEKARVVAQAALALAPQSSLAHQALGDIKLQADFDFAGAGEEYRRAIALAPSDPVPKVAYGAWLLARGALDDALVLLREALALDPVRTEAYTFSARALVGMGRLDEAEATARHGLEVQPDASRLHTVLTEIALLRNRPDLALAEARAESAGFWSEFAMTLALQKQGNDAAADAALAALIEHWADSGGSQIAIVYALRGEPDKLFEWLHKAYAARDTGALFVPLSDPFLLRYRTDPRFDAYLRKADFPVAAVH
jgi:serine/threonine-protein kinase